MDQVIDVSEFMNAEGLLEWEAPAGEWTILGIFDISLLAAVTIRHPMAAKGLRSTKCRLRRWIFYWKHFLDRVVGMAGDRAGLLNIRSGYCRCRWRIYSAGFDQKFAEVHGYDFEKGIAHFDWAVVGSVDFTERVLGDYRKLINDLVVENYYGRMQENCAKAGLKFATEPYGRYGNTNDYDVAGKVDIPTCEWWAYLGLRKIALAVARCVGSSYVRTEGCQPVYVHGDSATYF